ncbi:MAG: lysoplasmalogenase [Deltaproteobacteria bacterium]|nr:lysoplasmalogenase [Deltaproteobacteria bacterium]
MVNTAILIPAIFLLGLLLFFEKQENTKRMLPTKTALSGLFILAALVQPHPLMSYYQFVLIGLIFCLGGDVCLAMPQKKMFTLGLVSFLVGHLFYVLAFLKVAGFNILGVIGTLLTIGVSYGVFRWLKPHLGAMKIPVIAYIAVISAMVCGAWSIWGESGLPANGRLLVFIGALSFYVSDLFVARDRFLKNEFLNRFLGLPLYYAGQFMIAFSVGALS